MYLGLLMKRRKNEVIKFPEIDKYKYHDEYLNKILNLANFCSTYFSAYKENGTLLFANLI